MLHCVRACLERAGVSADAHLTLSDHGVRKRKHADFDPAQAQAVYRDAVLPAAKALATARPVQPDAAGAVEGSVPEPAGAGKAGQSQAPG